MVTPRISQLFIYPIKSCAGISVPSSALDAMGLTLDRRWCLTDNSGHFLSQRQLPRMALIKVELSPTGITVNAPGMSSLRLISIIDTHLDQPITIWNDHCTAASVSKEADEWFSTFLKRSCKLVQSTKDFQRPVDPNYGKPSDSIAFSDGFPLLLISEASLNLLNSKLQQPVGIERFRPNIVVSLDMPHGEDQWQQFSAAGITFRVVKPCARCAIPNIDPSSGVKNREPMKTLASYRRGESQQIYFGQNVIHDQLGSLKVGDTISVNQI